MLRALLRLLSRPLTATIEWACELLGQLRLGRAGMLELRVHSSMRHPLLSLRLLDSAVRRMRPRGLLLILEEPAWGWATLAEWRGALARWREDGLFIVVYSEQLGNRGLYLASVADRVLMPPLADVGLVGVAAKMSFYGQALNKLGVQVDVVAAGAYKSFGESYTRAYGSAENREAMGALVGDLNDELMRAVAEGRRLDPASVRALMTRSPLLAEQARQAGLIDVVCHEDGVDRVLEEMLGPRARRVRARGLSRLAQTADWMARFLSQDPVLAVVHLSGPVTSGQEPSSGAARIGAAEVAPVLRALREHPVIEGVVLSIQSPGGSALASDTIWREIELLGRSKPVVAHLSDVAASGGYYIAAPAREIVAHAGTITGSIGVVGGKLAIGGALARFGVHSEWIASGPNASMYSPDQPFDDAQRALFRARLQDTYDVFLRRVSAGRRRPVASIEPVAQGRVWSGRAALDAGLVDHIGGLDLAIERLRALVGIRPGQAVVRHDLVVAPPRPWMRRLLPAWGASAPAALRLVGLLPGPSEGMMLIAENPGEPMALLPVDLEI